MPFSDLGLSAKVLSAVEAAGYTEPTPIQAQAIPHALQRRDVLGIAQTGTGKTASFVLPMMTLLEQGRARARMPRTLIIEPTRELAAQVEESFIKYGVNQRLNVALLIGGVSFEEQNKKLERGVDVLIATPGRLLDHFERGRLLMTGVEILVIDEADRMLDMGFIPDIERICKMIPFTRQTLFFSATMPPEITRLADQFLQNPVRVEVAKASSTALTVEQRLVATRKEDYEKRETLRRVIRAQGEELTNAIIFCNRKRDVSLLFRSLEKHGFSVGALHGDMDQRARTMTLQAFRDNKLTLLVASDVAARGLDIPMVSHVFNFDVPIHAEDYVHRIGRTGRAGRSGKAFTLVSKADKKYLDAIQTMIGKEIEWLDGDVSSLPAVEESEETATSDRRRGGRRSETDGKRSSSRSGRTSRRGRDATAEAVIDDENAPETPAAVAVEKVTPEPVEAIRRSESRDDNRGPRRNDRLQPSSSGRRPNDRNGSGREEATPVGFGDEIPAFMLIQTGA
ncbi:DEAD/DEAH box helicase [Aureimonas phyllosphaerae]|uniref:DEAD-box ATP-dependent RNA helicase RhpA n=1 Tax=Aureimonas phyllosphaerae TaxID=1166078 RepID=A0A7W6BNU6_9HYPH|nr:DEAD/DEAH box helicase [Aureimonas phyllosphaerae]MBB3935389.1 superfamily II DNA/RNA helicase [Aureimonas phyllosphaerae]MBB3959397.1 superfamily II DNA/RNA helicase [Aureimonas phyllosphaerae]SFF03595.1 Superfamily II DNA and RNA helicase [Aureimonas phyllosphaerae]